MTFGSLVASHGHPQVDRKLGAISVAAMTPGGDAYPAHPDGEEATSMPARPRRPNPAGRSTPTLRMLFTARSLMEYQAMFGLSTRDLSCRLLDCPGGASSFAGSVRRQGGDVTSIDPLYTLPIQAITAHAIADAQRASRLVAASAQSYRFADWPSVDAHLAARLDAARAFGADLVAHPGRFIGGALPALPFSDGAFDLVLSGHLLFLYAPWLSFDFHVAALVEMARVSSGGVRVFPVCQQSLRRYGQLDRLRRVLLREHSVHTELRAVSYEFQRGANQMLVCGAPKGCTFPLSRRPLSLETPTA